MKAQALLPTPIATAVAVAFGRRLTPILSILLEKGEEKMKGLDASAMIAGGAARGRLVTVHTQAQYEAASRRLESEQQ